MGCKGVRPRAPRRGSGPCCSQCRCSPRGIVAAAAGHARQHHRRLPVCCTACRSVSLSVPLCLSCLSCGLSLPLALSLYLSLTLSIFLSATPQVVGGDGVGNLAVVLAGGATPTTRNNRFFRSGCTAPVGREIYRAASVARSPPQKTQTKSMPGHTSQVGGRRVLFPGPGCVQKPSRLARRTRQHTISCSPDVETSLSTVAKCFRVTCTTNGG